MDVKTVFEERKIGTYSIWLEMKPRNKKKIQFKQRSAYNNGSFASNMIAISLNTQFATIFSLFGQILADNSVQPHIDRNSTYLVPGTDSRSNFSVD